MKKHSQSGFSAIEVLLVAIIVIVIGAVGWFVWHSKQTADTAYKAADETSATSVVKKKSTTTGQEAAQVDAGPDKAKAAQSQTPAATATTKEPAMSDSPASGACAGEKGGGVTVKITTDIPMPRCIKVNAEQLLTVYNESGQPITVTLGSQSLKLSATKDDVGQISIKHFGEYLEPGVHVVKVTGEKGALYGPEIWLQ